MSDKKSDLVVARPAGLYCPAGDFYIDPMRPVKRAIITHAHGDHARGGSREYWAAVPGLKILEHRISTEAPINAREYGETFEVGGTRLSFHSAGHVLGSAQVRIECGDRVWVASGDYKRLRDPTCEPFEVVECDTFITESTFAMPIYRWQSGEAIGQEALDWLAECRARDQTAILFCYALGKAQRILAEMAHGLDRTVYLHGATVPLVEKYRESGVSLPETAPVSSMEKGYKFTGDLVLAPPSAAGSPWMRRFPKRSTGFLSGWMRIRGNRRRRGYDRGFVMSDHADWPGLIRTIRESRADRIICMHGRSDIMVRYLREKGIAAESLNTSFEPDPESAG